ncbi:MAG: exopolysaccharide Pel transporter PelG [Nitrospinae bacterium]|nr:exopolysaccharide Pel transporter PelG [Nitrospinota bacterium]
MAGIGFVLRKLKQQDDLISILQGYAHSATVSMGPWLLTILSLGTISLVGSKLTSLNDLSNFRIIIIYNFAFSLVLSGPIVWVVTRYIADLLYRKDVKEVPSTMMGSLVIMFFSLIFFAAPLYLFYLNLDLNIRIAAIFNFFLIAGMWLISVFLSSLKDYIFITVSYAVGMSLGIVSAIILTPSYSVVGMLMGFNIGLAVIVYSLIARIFTIYPCKTIKPFGFTAYFKKYWDLALSGFIYNLSIWIDKWIMWFTPERVIFDNGLISYPNYDSAMFLAYLSIVPSMALFIMVIETNFYEYYLKFYGGIQMHNTYSEIQENQKDIIKHIGESSRDFLILQGSICIVVILLSTRIFNLLGINFLQLGIFRFGVLGSLFFIMTSFLAIILSYFDLRRVVLLIYSLFLLSNTVFTYITMKLGFAYYGYGYFLASIVTFTIAYPLTIYYTNRLPYIAFVRNNPSVN